MFSTTSWFTIYSLWGLTLFKNIQTSSWNLDAVPIKMRQTVPVCCLLQTTV